MGFQSSVDATGLGVRVLRAGGLAGRTEIVFIDALVDDWATLAEAALPGVEVVLVTARGGGLVAIARYLEMRGGADAIAIVSHGGPGELLLGGEAVNRLSLPEHGRTLASIGAALREDGGIMLYACELALGAAGRGLLERLAALTGVPVRGALAPVGHAAHGGDWTLPAAAGGWFAAELFDPALLATYPAVLAGASYISTTGTNVDTKNTTTGLISVGNLITFDTLDVTQVPTASAQVIFRAYDVDYGLVNASGTAYPIGNANSEWDGVYAEFNNSGTWSFVGYLTGSNNTWNYSSLNVTSLVQQDGAGDYTFRVVPDDNGAGTQANDGGKWVVGVASAEMLIDGGGSGYTIGAPTESGAAASAVVTAGTAGSFVVEYDLIDASGHDVAACSVTEALGAGASTVNGTLAYNTDFYSAFSQIPVGSYTLEATLLNTTGTVLATSAAPYLIAPAAAQGGAVSAVVTTISAGSWTGNSAADRLHAATTDTGPQILGNLTAVASTTRTTYVDVYVDGIYAGTASVNANSTSFALQLGAGSARVNYSTLVLTPGEHVFSAVYAPNAAPGVVADYTQAGSPVTLDGTLGVTLSNNATLSGASVRIANGIAGDVLQAMVTPGTIHQSYANGTLTLSGIASAADYQSALDSVVFSSTGGNPTNYGAADQRTIDWQVTTSHYSQTTTSAVATTSLVITPVDQAPTVSAGGTIGYAAGEGAVPVDLGLGLADPDSRTLASATVWISGGFNTADVLGFVNTGSAGEGNITGSYNAGTLTLSSVGATASLAQWQAAMEAVTYANSSGTLAAATRTLSLVVNDGSLASAVATRTINVGGSAGNAAPVLGGGAGLVGFVQADGAVLVQPGLTVSDSDSPTLASATVWISGTVSTAAVLGFVNTGTAGEGNITGSYNAGTLTLSSVGATASLAQWQTALDAVTFNTTATSGTVALRTVVNDGRGVNNLSNTISTTVSIGSHTAPVLSAGGNTVSLANASLATSRWGTVAAGGVTVDSGLVLSDPDRSSIASATVAIVNYSTIANAGEVLTYTGTSSLGVQGTFNARTGVLTLTPGFGTTLTAAAMQSALRDVVFQSTTISPSASNATIAFNVVDSSGSLNTSNTITITSTVVVGSGLGFVTSAGTASSQPTGTISVGGGTIVPQTTGFSATAARYSLLIDAPSTIVPAILMVDGTLGLHSTTDRLPTLSGTSAAGVTVAIYEGATELGSTVADARGNWSFSLPNADALANLSYGFTATDLVNGLSSPSYALTETSQAPFTTVSNIHISNDTGASATDFITSVAAQTITATLSEGLQPGETLEASVDSGNSWVVVPTADITGTTVSLAGAVLETGYQVPSNSVQYNIEFQVVNASGGSPIVTQGYLVVPPLGSPVITQVEYQTAATPTLVGTADPNSVLTITWVVGGTTYTGTAQPDVNGNWSFTLPGPLANGSYPFTVTAADPTSGEVAPNDAMKTVWIDTTLPSVNSIHISNDTGSSNADFITDVAAQTSITARLSGTLASGGTLFESLNGGTSWVQVSGSCISGTTVSVSGQTLDVGANTIEFQVRNTATGAGGGMGTQGYVLDLVVPTLAAAGASVDTTNDVIYLNFNPTVSGLDVTQVPTAADFSVVQNGTTTLTPTGVTVLGPTGVALAFAPGIFNPDDTFTVSYTRPGSGTVLQSVAGEPVASFSTINVLNPLVVQAVNATATALAAGGSNGQIPGTNPVGNVTVNDSGAGIAVDQIEAGTTLDGNATAVPGSTSAGDGGISIAGTYGTLTIGADGSYLYTVNNANAAVRAMNVGNTLTDGFAYDITDSSGNSSSAELVVTIDGADQAPVLAGAAVTTTYAAGRGAVAVDGSITVADVDNATQASATVAITGGYVAGEDVLGFSNTSATSYGNISGSYAGGILTLTSAGGTASLAQWQAALRAVTYSDTAASPTTGQRTIAYTINDGTYASNLLSAGTVVVAGLTDALLSNSDNLPAGTVDNGDTLVYVLDITPGLGTQTLSVADVLPAGVTFRAASVAATGGVTGTIVTTPSVTSSGTNVALNFGTIVSPAAGAGPIVVDVTVVAATTLADQAVLNSHATGTLTPAGGGAVTLTSGTVSELVVAPVLSVSDSVTGAVPGSPGTYTVAIVNSGHANAYGVAVSDLLPAGVTASSILDSGSTACGAVNWQGQTVIAGGTLDLTFVGNFTNAVTSGATLTNSSTITAFATQPSGGATIAPVGVTGSVQSRATLTGQPSLAITTTGSGTSAGAGSTIGYTLAVVNSGSVTATGITVADILPADMVAGTINGGSVASNGTIQWSGLTLAAGGTLDLTFAGSYAATVKPGETLTDTASVTSYTWANGTTLNSPASSFTTTATLTPTITDALQSNSDGLPSGTVDNGDTLVYVLNITPGLGTQVLSVADALPAGVTFRAATVASTGGVTGAHVSSPTISAGGGGEVLNFGTVVSPGTGSGTITVDVTVVAANTLADQAVLSSNATVTAAPLSGSAGTQTGTSGIVNELVVAPVLSITDSVAGAGPGSPGTYTVAIVNSGHANAYGVAVSDLLPAGVTASAISISNGGTTAGGAVNWQGLTVNAGGTLDLSFVGNYSGAVISGGTLTNSSTITAYATKPSGGATIAPVGVTGSVQSVATLASPRITDAPLSNSDNLPSGTVDNGDTLVYVLNITPGLGTQVLSVADALPAGVTFRAATVASTGGVTGAHVSSPTISAGGGGEVLNFGTVVSSGTGSGTITVDVTVVAANTLADQTVLSSSATVTSAPLSGSAGTQTGTSGIVNELVVAPVLSISDSVTGAGPGSPGTYTVAIVNSGAANAYGVAMSNLLPTGVTASAISNGGTTASGAVNWHGLTVNAGGTLDLTFVGNFTTAVTSGAALTNSSTITAYATKPSGGATITPVGVTGSVQAVATLASITETLTNAGTIASVLYYTSNSQLTGVSNAIGGTVTLTAGVVVLGTATVQNSGTWSFTPAVMSQGTHTVLATVDGAAASIGFVYDTQPPAAPLVNQLPENSAQLSKVQRLSGLGCNDYTASDVISGTGVAGDTIDIAALVGGVVSQIGSTVVGGGGTWSFTAGSLPQGVNHLEVTQVDPVGNSSTAGYYDFIYDTVPPGLSMSITRSGGASGAIQKISGTGGVGGVVALSNGQASIGSANVGANGTWSLIPSLGYAGAAGVIATEVDYAGNRSVAIGGSGISISLPAAPNTALTDNGTGTRITIGSAGGPAIGNIVLNLAADPSFQLDLIGNTGSIAALPISSVVGGSTYLSFDGGTVDLVGIANTPSIVAHVTLG